MNTQKLPVGIDSFEKLRKEDFYYVDKSGLIIELMQNWGVVNRFTRPRRFGGQDVYCPWDVINYCYALRASECAQPKAY